MKKLQRIIACVVTAWLVLCSSGPAVAQKFPAKALRWVVPFPPGGPLDVMARLVAQRLSDGIGQPVIVDNRAGANGIIGTEFVVRAPADGYTLLTGSPGTIAINPALYRLGFSPMRDLAPVTQILAGSFVLLVHPSLPASTFGEFLALARRQPGVLNYASYGSGSSPHLAMELLKRAAKIDLLHVPYKGTAPAFADLLAGQVSVMFDAPVTAMPQIRAGKLRALAVSVAKRHPLLPDTPAVAETFAGFNADGWQGVFVPAGTPRDVIAYLNVELVKAIRSPEIQKRIADLASETIAGTAEEFSEKVAADTARWAEVIREAAIKAD